MLLASGEEKKQTQEVKKKKERRKAVEPRTICWVHIDCTFRDSKDESGLNPTWRVVEKT